jgi:hypothetical protein
MFTQELGLESSVSIVAKTKALRLAELAYKVVLKSSLLQRLVYGLVRFVSPTRICIENVFIYLNKNDAVLNSLLLLGLFEIPETIIFKKLLQPGMTFLDVGANVGYFSAIASSLVGPKGTIIALEPEPKNHALLRETTLANPGPTYYLLQVAASAKKGTSTFHVSSSNCGDNRLADGTVVSDEQEWSSITVDCDTLDNLFQEKNLPLPDLIKIDVQGFEADVIAGCANILKTKQSIALMIEFWPEGLRLAGKSPLEFLRTIREQGFYMQHINLKGQLVELSDDEELIRTYQGKAYTNLFCTR